MTQTPAGWFPSPENDGRQRYWDGEKWTEHYAPGPGAAQPTAPMQARDPNVIWEAVGKPMAKMGAGRYRLTSHYLFFEKGTLRTDSQQVPISAVLDVDVSQTMSQKARGVGTIVVHIQRPRGVERVPLVDIEEYREGQRLINETAHAARAIIQRNQNTHRYENTSIPFQGGQQPPTAAGEALAAIDPIAQLRQLGELRDAGILSDDEFAAKKAEILGRM